jgi:hypothetical protein
MSINYLKPFLRLNFIEEQLICGHYLRVRDIIKYIILDEIQDER